MTSHDYDETLAPPPQKLSVYATTDKCTSWKKSLLFRRVCSYCQTHFFGLKEAFYAQVSSVLAVMDVPGCLVNVDGENSASGKVQC